jgi:hypothetical protein
MSQIIKKKQHNIEILAIVVPADVGSYHDIYKKVMTQKIKEQPYEMCCMLHCGDTKLKYLLNELVDSYENIRSWEHLMNILAKSIPGIHTATHNLTYARSCGKFSETNIGEYRNYVNYKEKTLHVWLYKRDVKHFKINPLQAKL